MLAGVDRIDWAGLGLKRYRLGHAIRLKSMGAPKLDIGVPYTGMAGLQAVAAWSGVSQGHDALWGNLQVGCCSSHFFLRRRQVPQPVLVRLEKLRLRGLCAAGVPVTGGPGGGEFDLGTG